MSELALPEPNNGHEVLYLFSKFHGALGFEEITHISNLWVEAKRNGHPVKVRVRHSSREFLLDYQVDTCCGCLVGSKWVKENGVWIVRNKDGTKGCGFKRNEYPDPNDEYTEGMVPGPFLIANKGCLFRQSMKGIVDVLVCWKVNSGVEDDIEVLELSKLFHTKTIRKQRKILKSKYRKRKRLRPSTQLLMLLFEKGEVAKPDVYRLVDARPEGTKNMLKRLEERGWIRVMRQDGSLKFTG